MLDVATKKPREGGLSGECGVEARLTGVGAGKEGRWGGRGMMGRTLWKLDFQGKREDRWVAAGARTGKHH